MLAQAENGWRCYHCCYHSRAAVTWIQYFSGAEVPTMPMTGKLTDLNVSTWIRVGVARGARAILVVYDRFPWPTEPYPIFVRPGASVAKRFAVLDGVGMQRVV